MAETITESIVDDPTVRVVVATANGYAEIPGTAVKDVFEITPPADLDATLGRPAVRVAATVNISLSGEQTIAGVACVAGDRVLLTAQTNAKQNRTYVVASGSWSATGDNLASGSWWYANEGSNAGLWQLVTADPITPGTTNLTVVRRAGGTAAAHASSHASAGGDPVLIDQSQVSGLEDALAAKAASTHNHDSAYAPLTGNVISSYRVYLASDGSSMAATTSQVVAFSNELSAVSGYSLSGGEVTLAAAGRYQIKVELGASGTTANTKISTPVALQTDNGGTWANITGAEADLTEGGSSSEILYQRARCTIEWELTTTAANKKVRVNVGPSITASSALVMKANRCRMTIERIG